MVSKYVVRRGFNCHGVHYPKGLYIENAEELLPRYRSFRRRGRLRRMHPTYEPTPEQLDIKPIVFGTDGLTTIVPEKLLAALNSRYKLEEAKEPRPPSNEVVEDKKDKAAAKPKVSKPKKPSEKQKRAILGK